MISSIKLLLPFIAVSFMALSCSSLHSHHPLQDGPYTMRNCQPLPTDFLHRAFSPPETLSSQFQPYIDFWAKTDVSRLTPKLFNQARAILYRLASGDSLDDTQRKTADALALKLEHATSMFDVATAISEPPEDADDMEDTLNEARSLMKMRKRFPALAEPSLLQAEHANGDCLLQEFVKLFEDCAPVRLPLVRWNLQSASSYKLANETIAREISQNIACLSASVDLFNDQAEMFINFRSLPKGTAIHINGAPQSLPDNAASGTFRLQLPPYDKADGRAVITLLVPLPLPMEPMFAPWLSQRQQQ